MSGDDIRSKFLAKAGEPAQYKPVDTPFGTLHIKKMTVGERDKFESAADGNAGNRALIVIHTACDERGAKIFTEEDVTELREIDPDILDPIVMVALKFNRYTKEEQAALLKNSNGQVTYS